MNEPTPRPWHARGNNVEDAANNLVAITHRGMHVYGDATLIVEAVNDHDRLHAIEAAALATLGDPAEWPPEDEWDEPMLALRFALSPVGTPVPEEATLPSGDARVAAL